MGLFNSSKSHLELLQEQCNLVIGLSKTVRSHCDRSLRGKYDYMRPEERADLVRMAHEENQRLVAALERAKSKQSTLDDDGTEAVMAAESVLLSASLDAAEAQKSLNEAHASLVHGVSEVEQFYGSRSKEAKHLRKVLAHVQVSA